MTKWIEADAEGVATILASGNNYLIKRREVPTDSVVMPCVTQRRLKVDPATGAPTAFKSRHCVDGRRQAQIHSEKGIPSAACHSTNLHLLTMFMMVASAAADSAATRRELAALDVVGAYPKAKKGNRPITYMALPSSTPQVDEAGDKLCIACNDPVWGEGPSGNEWQRDLAASLTSIGYAPCEAVPALWAVPRLDDKISVVGTLVDDMLIVNEPGATDPGGDVRRGLEARYGEGEIKYSRNPTSFNGFKFVYRPNGAISVSCPLKLREASLAHLGETPQASDFLCGGKLRRALSDLVIEPAPVEGRYVLSAEGRSFNAVLGDLRWPAHVDPSLALACSILSCVASRPPPGSLLVARSVLFAACVNAERGVTYGGGIGAPQRPVSDAPFIFSLGETRFVDLVGFADAGWGSPKGDRLGSAIVCNGGMVLAESTKFPFAVASSTESEGLAVARVARGLLHAREIGIVLGIVDPEHPTLLVCDNKQTVDIINGSCGPRRIKHAMRRFVITMQRVADGLLTLSHVPDADNPVDFLTKWIPSAKFKASVDYLCGVDGHG